MRVLLLTEPAMHTDPTDTRLARLVGAVAPLGDVTLLLAGDIGSLNVQRIAAWTGVTELLVATHPTRTDGSAEQIAAWIVALAGQFSHIAAATSTLGAAVMPRVAAMLDRPLLTGVQTICSADTFVRPVLTGNALATVRVHGTPVCLTLQPAGFTPAQPHTPTTASIRHLTPAATIHAQWARLLTCTPIPPSKRP
ncbi:MAG: hypothetical protein H7838_04910, partial [Magnetococcus sp. DMHC-8]